MSGPNFMILYVENAQKSGAFYSTLLGRAPVDASPAFVMFARPGFRKSGAAPGRSGREWPRSAIAARRNLSEGGVQ